jgi:hypothetical protein
MLYTKKGCWLNIIFDILTALLFFFKSLFRIFNSFNIIILIIVKILNDLNIDIICKECEGDWNSSFKFKPIKKKNYFTITCKRLIKAFVYQNVANLILYNNTH